MKLLIAAVCLISLSAGCWTTGSSSEGPHAVILEKVLILGVCQDVESRLPGSIRIMEKMGSLFEDYRIIVYENNSKDNTAKLLSAWSTRNSKVLVRSENVSRAELEATIINRKDGEFFRPELIARARNIVMDMAMSDVYKDFTHVIWMDMDFVIQPNYDGIVEAFETTKEWDAVLAYGVDPGEKHWDWYAFRDASMPIGSELLGNAWWYMPKNFSLKATDDWHPVYSAFGGCGIYKKSSLEGCRYSAIITKDLEDSARDIINDGLKTEHPHIAQYEQRREQDTVVSVNEPRPNLCRIEDPTVGVHLNFGPDPLVWRMSSFVYEYPSTCEHVPLHACMIRNGHGKLFINPRLVFRYGG